MVKILSTGMYRSGSTWLFNALRLLIVDNYSCFYGDYVEKNKKNVHIIKTQKYYNELANDSQMIFSIYREIKETKESMIRRQEYAQDGFTQETKVELFDTFFHNTMLYNMKADYIIDYNEIISNPEKIVSTIYVLISKLYPDVQLVTFARIKPIVEELRNLTTPSKGYDAVTLMHANHITKK